MNIFSNLGQKKMTARSLEEFLELAISTRNRTERDDYIDTSDGMCDCEDVCHFTADDVVLSSQLTTL
jgi:hypothetical protein